MKHDRAMITPLILLDGLAKSDPYIKTIFLDGSCYKLHLFLKSIWPQAIPVINVEKNHVATLIDGVIYDITGIAKEKFVMMNYADIMIAEKWSFAKKAMLQIAECPVCEEPIVI